jgi:plastocyanin
LGFVSILILNRAGYPLMGKPFIDKKLLVSCVIISMLLIITSYPSNVFTKSIFASKSTSEKTTDSSSASESAADNQDSNSIVMNALELTNGTYRWENASHGINPTLHLVPGTDYNIKIDNPTDSKHELIVGTNGTEIAGSKSVKAGKNTEFIFNANSSGILEYHCEYHPDTMKGIIEISSQ